MNLVGLRVDERLIHGQVATAWLNHYRAERIMVIDDAIIQSSIEKMALKMACPSHCKLSILSLDSAVANLQAQKYGEQRIFIIAKVPDYFLKLLERNIFLDHVVLGNMSEKANSKRLRKSVYVDQKDINTLSQMIDKGVKVTLQMTPGDTSERFENALENIGGTIT